jgi:hypothetical protein
LEEGKTPGSEKVKGQEVNFVIGIFLHYIYKNSVRTSQESHYVSATETNRLMLFKETIVVYCENHREHTNTLCGQYAVSEC